LSLVALARSVMHSLSSTGPGTCGRRLWVATALWTAVIYFTIPVARRVQTFVAERWGREQFRYLVYAALVVAAGGLLLRAVRRAGRLQRHHLWIMAVGLAFYGLASHLRMQPEEAVHFVEYGVLGGLLAYAWRDVLGDGAAWAAAIISGCTIGMADEIIQWITPGRFWDLRDIGMNAAGVVLGVGAVVLGIRPSAVQRDSAASWRTVLRLGWIAAGVLLFMLASTPEVIAWYARLPGLSFLRHSESMLADYGYLIRDQEIGLFYSRFTPAELRETDRRRGREAGRAYRACPAAGSAARFRKVVSPVVDPFLHEAGLHIIRRNEYLAVLPRHRADPADEAFHARVAWAENRILEKYFSNTLVAAGQAWPPERVARLRRLARRCGEFRSTVSEQLIVRFRRWQAVGLVGVLLVGCMVGDMLLGRKLQRGEGQQGV